MFLGVKVHPDISQNGLSALFYCWPQLLHGCKLCLSILQLWGFYSLHWCPFQSLSAYACEELEKKWHLQRMWHLWRWPDQISSSALKNGRILRQDSHTFWSGGFFESLKLSWGRAIMIKVVATAAVHRISAVLWCLGEPGGRASWSVCVLDWGFQWPEVAHGL